MERRAERELRRWEFRGEKVVGEARWGGCDDFPFFSFMSWVCLIFLL